MRNAARQARYAEDVMLYNAAERFGWVGECAECVIALRVEDHVALCCWAFGRIGECALAFKKKEIMLWQPAEQS